MWVNEDADNSAASPRKTILLMLLPQSGLEFITLKIGMSMADFQGTILSAACNIFDTDRLKNRPDLGAGSKAKTNDKRQGF